MGANHPDVAATLSNLAVAMQGQGELDAAKVMYQRALSILEATLGPNHPDAAATLGNLGVLLNQQGKACRGQGPHEAGACH